MSGDASADRGFSLRFDERGRLVLSRPGTDDVVDVRVRRAFPWSKPERFVSVRSSEGKELLIIEDLSAVPTDVRDAVERYLAGEAVEDLAKDYDCETLDIEEAIRVEWRLELAA